MKRAAVFLLILAFLVLPLGACMDGREVNSWAFPYILGIDKGVADRLRFTILMPTLKGSQSSGGRGTNGGEETTFISIDCPTFESGIVQINSFLSRRVNCTHVEIMVIGEELAKQGVASLFEGLRITRQVREDMDVVVIKGEASKFIEEFKPVLGESISGIISGLMSATEQTGLIERDTFLKVIQTLKSSDESASCTLSAVADYSRYQPAGSKAEHIEIPDLMPGQIPRIGGDVIELLGTAVFNGDRLAGELDLGETRALLMVKGEFVSGITTIHDPLDEELYITTLVRSSKGPDISVSTTGGEPVINVKVYMEGSIQTQQSEIEYMNSDKMTLLEKTYAEFIVKNIADVIRKCQGMGSDVFKFSEAAKKNFWTIQDWQNYNWRQRFPEAQINIKATFTMLRTGIVVENKPVQNAGGGQ